jgi:radical SAM protein with 4Fe4S-binding SPASM domain
MNKLQFALPTYVQIEPVGQCNLRCQMCPIQFRQDGPPYGPPAFMEFDTYTRLIDQFTTLKDLHLQGLGEPMMHPRYFDMVRYAVMKGIRVTTNTNLTLLNAKRAVETVTCGLDTLHVSIDGATAETYDRIRVRAHFERVLRNLELLLETRDGYQSELPHLKMVMVIMRQNLTELPDLVRLAARYRMEEVFVQHLAHDFGEESLPEHYAPMRQFVQEQTLFEVEIDQIERYFGEARQVAEELGVHLRLPHPRMRFHPPGTPGQDRCSWPWTGGYISYEGYAMPCCMVATPDRINFGNMATDGVQAIWNNEAFAEFRSQLSSDTPPAICQSCSVYTGTF